MTFDAWPEVRIPHRLLPLVAPEVRDRVMKFYMQTFWANISVFRCHQAPSHAPGLAGLNKQKHVDAWMPTFRSITLSLLDSCSPCVCAS